MIISNYVQVILASFFYFLLYNFLRLNDSRNIFPTYIFLVQVYCISCISLKKYKEKNSAQRDLYIVRSFENKIKRNLYIEEYRYITVWVYRLYPSFVLTQLYLSFSFFITHFLKLKKKCSYEKNDRKANVL